MKIRIRSDYAPYRIFYALHQVGGAGDIPGLEEPVVAARLVEEVQECCLVLPRATRVCFTQIDFHFFSILNFAKKYRQY